LDELIKISLRSFNLCYKKSRIHELDTPRTATSTSVSMCRPLVNGFKQIRIIYTHCALTSARWWLLVSINELTLRRGR